MDDPFVLAGETFSSRLIMGTGGIPSLDVLDGALVASGTEITTVAMRRLDPAAQGSILDVLARRGVRVLPNTAGCYTAADADSHRATRPRGVGDVVGEARGHRRRAHVAA